MDLCGTPLTAALLIDNEFYWFIASHLVKRYLKESACFCKPRTGKSSERCFQRRELVAFQSFFTVRVPDYRQTVARYHPHGLVCDSGTVDPSNFRTPVSHSGI